MKFSIHLIADARQDILDICRYVVRNDSKEKAVRLLDNLEKSILRLASLPERGHYPVELERVGVREYREIVFKPYRIIYQVVKSDVYVHCVLDGRRDLQDLLVERLLR